MTFTVYMGWDPNDHAAYSVAVHSLLAHASIPVEIVPVVERDLRREGFYWRSYHVDRQGQMWDDRDGKPFSTQFSFTRFCVPLIEGFANRWVAFVDPDVMFRADIAELVGLIDERYGVMCVHHDHRPPESMKMHGVMQTRYARKNWSSVMLLNPSKCRGLGRYDVNNRAGSDLHGFTWIQDDLIGEIPEEWNWLEGYSDPVHAPRIVHYTRGTPDMIGSCAHDGEWWAHYRAADVPSPLLPTGKEKTHEPAAG